MSLTGHTVTYDMAATPDWPTPINLAQHNYYALASGPCHDQTLMIAASKYTPTGPDLIPTGQIAPLDGAAFDFRKPRSLAAADPECHGIDHTYVLDLIDGPAARLTATTGLTLEMETDQPVCSIPRRIWHPLKPRCQAHACRPLPGTPGFSNAVNEPGFPSIITTPDCPYRQVLRVDGVGFAREAAPEIGFAFASFLLPGNSNRKTMDLVADIGSTNTRLAENGRPLDSTRSFRNRQFKALMTRWARSCPKWATPCQTPSASPLPDRSRAAMAS